MPEPDLVPSPPAAGTVVAAEPRWGIGDALVGWLLAQVGGAIAVSIVLGVTDKEVDDLSLGLIVLVQVGLWAGFLGVPWVAARFKGNGLVADFGLRIEAWDVLYGGFWGLFTQIVLIPVVYLPILQLTNVDANDLSEPARNLTDRAGDPFGVVMLVVIVGIGAPIFEELFYRGLVLRSLERRLGPRFGPWPAVVISGIFFGASHFEPLQFPALAVFGVVLGVLTVRSGRLGPAISAHMAFNLVTVVALLVD